MSHTTLSTCGTEPFLKVTLRFQAIIPKDMVPKDYPVVRIITRLNVGGAERYVCTLSAHVNSRKFPGRLICGRPGKSERQWSELAAEARVLPVFLEEMRR